MTELSASGSPVDAANARCNNPASMLEPAWRRTSSWIIGHDRGRYDDARIRFLAREVLIRRTPLRSGGWLFFLVTCVCLAISACYEFVEWFAAVLGGSSADAFLGTQGDVWDTQWDMLMAFIGAMTAQILLARVQDKQLARL